MKLILSILALLLSIFTPTKEITRAVNPLVVHFEKIMVSVARLYEYEINISVEGPKGIERRLEVIPVLNNGNRDAAIIDVTQTTSLSMYKIYTDRNFKHSYLIFNLYVNNILMENYNVRLSSGYNLYMHEQCYKSVVSTQNAFIYTPKYGATYYNEKITLLEFNGVIELGKYHKLDFSKIRFKYECEYLDELLGIDASFTIYDKNGIMGDITKEKGMIDIPLYPVYDKENDEYFFTSEYELFVNSSNLKMSTQDDPSAVITDSFFLAEDYINQIDKLEFSLGMLNVGQNRTSLITNMKVHTSSTILGDCSGSQYCVSSNPSEPDFESGKVIYYS